MKPLNLFFFIALLSLAIGMQPISAQIIDAEGQYVDTTFNDNINRSADDFVIASLIIADPGTVLYSVLGHACIRMQCPILNKDYCFSYESEATNQKVLSFLTGKLTMGLLAIPTKEYCSQYSKQGRGVYEYTLNLPIETKRELWRVLDEHLAKDIHIPYDYFHHGCAITAKKFIEEALGKTKIEYNKSLFEYTPTARELWIEYTQNAEWAQFFALSLAGNETGKLLFGDKQLIIPIDLVHAWQEAKVNDKSLLASEPIILVKGKPHFANNWFTPMALALLLLILSIANLFWNRPYFDWLMLLVQTLIGCGITYLICFSNLCCTEWNWLIIPFNPLPIIFWRWRKYWALPYAGVLILWCIAMSAISIWWHILMSWSHIVLGLTIAVTVFKYKK